MYMNPPHNQQQYCYQNWVLINFNGQVNCNAMNSYSDGVNILQDISTIRFFINSGIEIS